MSLISTIICMFLLWGTDIILEFSSSFFFGLHRSASVLIVSAAVTGSPNGLHVIWNLETLRVICLQYNDQFTFKLSFRLPMSYASWLKRHIQLFRSPSLILEIDCLGWRVRFNGLIWEWRFSTCWQSMENLLRDGQFMLVGWQRYFELLPN